MSGDSHSLVCGSPVGTLTLTENDGALVSIEWGEGPSDPSPLLRDAADQLAAYFNGDLHDFDLPLAPQGSQFLKQVCEAMLTIPHGDTKTYGDIANQIGSAARAVGMACGRNPIPIVIPCHRVVGAGGKLTGYSGQGGLDTKKFLLRHEAG